MLFDSAIWLLRLLVAVPGRDDVEPVIPALVRDPVVS
jgi:hypothetical protein